MSNTMIIEIDDRAVGLVMPESPSRGFLFFAADPRLAAMDGQAVRLPHDAERLARDLIRRSPDRGRAEESSR